MKKETIHDALNFLDDEMIEAVDVLRKNKKQRKVNWKMWGSLAAGICLLVGITIFAKYGLFGIQNETGGAMSDSAAESSEGVEMAADPVSEGKEAEESATEDSAAKEAISENDAEVGKASGEESATEESSGSVSSGQMQGSKQDGVTIPAMEVDLCKNVSSDMAAFFMYTGRIYVQDEWIYDHPELVGEYLGTATGKIDEWTKQDGYVELAGSIEGDFYTVNGYDPAFMLCMKEEDGAVTTFINDNGITLYTGADLFEDRLKLEGNYDVVLWQDKEAFWYSEEATQVRTEDLDFIKRFIEEINQAEFVYADEHAVDQLFDEETQVYHLIFEMKNGMTVDLEICEDGTVFYRRMSEVCVKIDASWYVKLVDVLMS